MLNRLSNDPHLWVLPPSPSPCCAATVLHKKVPHVFVAFYVKSQVFVQSIIMWGVLLDAQTHPRPTTEAARPPTNIRMRVQHTYPNFWLYFSMPANTDPNRAYTRIYKDPSLWQVLATLNRGRIGTQMVPLDASRQGQSKKVGLGSWPRPHFLGERPKW